jgi:peptidoglycan/LPS O-acetylase OafA/YrhL
MAPGTLRFLLATLVVVFHYSSFGVGHMPVYLFFALSGYWVFTMWQNKYSATREPYVTFIISRAWRLAPVFLLCSFAALAVSFLLPLVLAPADPFTPPDPLALISSVFVIGYNSAVGAPLVPAWSLDIELQFYLVAPLIIALLQRRALLAVALCAAVSVVSFALFYDRASTSYLPWFLAGMLAARYPALLPTRRVALASGAITVGVVVLFACVPALRPVLFGGAHRGALYMTWNPLFNAALAALALPFALGTLSVRSGKLDRLLSDASYSLYLAHWLPLLYVSHYVPQIAALPHLSRALATLPLVLLSYAAAFAITVYVDRPCSQARERFVKARRAAREQPAAATLAR